uniref:MBD domain-containing protein n=1 Tax=Leersia perrieri TaxID=77586 RepID=A0A0D9XZH0_9ORYZ
MDESPSKVILDDEDYNEVKSLEEGMKNLLEPPGWLPDGWIMEVNRDNDGAIYRYYTCPFSGITFTMKSDVLRYLFSGIDQYSLESKNCDVYDNLTRTHDWLPNGWLVEIRAGGENMDKMYKFYVYEQTGVRLFSKEDVLLYINGMKISRFYTNGQCDASTLENILATLEFNPKGFPEGWVKEVVYRGTNVGGIRKDRHYTDPVRNLVFRTKKQAETYLKTGKVPKLAFVQKTSVHEVYSFEMSAPLVIVLPNHLQFLAHFTLTKTH